MGKGGVGVRGERFPSLGNLGGAWKCSLLSWKCFHPLFPNFFPGNPSHPPFSLKFFLEIFLGNFSWKSFLEIFPGNHFCSPYPKSLPETPDPLFSPICPGNPSLSPYPKLFPGNPSSPTTHPKFFPGILLTPYPTFLPANPFPKLLLESLLTFPYPGFFFSQPAPTWP